MRALIASAIAATLAPATAFAQAWVPPAGDGTVAIVYQNQLIRDHLLADGSHVDAGHIASNSLLLDFTYGVTDKFALNVNIPYISSAYYGTHPHPRSPLDVGGSHGTFQDFRIDLRYNVANRSMLLTPFVDIIVPSHRYDFYGHAAPGRRLAEVQVGAYFGHVLTRGLPGAFVQTRLSYGFAERPLHQYHDRSNADAEVGYFINPRLRTFGLIASQYTYDGILLTTSFPNDLTDAEFYHHDQLTRSNLFDIGGGVQVQVTRRMNLVGSYATTVAGRNGHALDRGLSLGASWSFGKSFKAMQQIGGKEVGQGLPRCLCQKGKSGP